MAISLPDKAGLAAFIRAAAPATKGVENYNITFREIMLFNVKKALVALRYISKNFLLSGRQKKMPFPASLFN